MKNKLPKTYIDYLNPEHIGDFYLYRPEIGLTLCMKGVNIIELEMLNHMQILLVDMCTFKIETEKSIIPDNCDDLILWQARKAEGNNLIGKGHIATVNYTQNDKQGEWLLSLAYNSLTITQSVIVHEIVHMIDFISEKIGAQGEKELRGYMAQFLFDKLSKLVFKPKNS